MEAIYLACGAGGPQLKRNPLGCGTPPDLSPDTDFWMPMFTIEIGAFRLFYLPDGLSATYSSYRERATLREEIELDRVDVATQCFVAVGRAGHDWPFLVVAQRYSPTGHGFEPGALIVPETDRLFLGAGQRLLAYDLSAPRRLWEDMTYIGFWGWARHGDVVLMSAELELAAWDLKGEKLWRTSVEPPWTYEVTGDAVHLDVMGAKSRFLLKSGPNRAS
jgi:hypothetical protein